MTASRHLVDPELMEFLDTWPKLHITSENLAALRATWREGSVELELTESAQELKGSTVHVPGPAGAPEVALHIYQPPHLSRPAGAIFHIHGGGYIGAEAATAEPIHRQLAADLNCVLTSVDYRVAPETCFPGNIEDCYAGLSWFYRHATDFHVDPKRIGVMGESAGGGLAAALALLARDRLEIGLAFQHLIYPMIDDRTCVAAEPHPFTGEFVWTADNNRFGWSALLGAAPGGKNVSPYAAASRAENLAGLPPTFMSTAALDLFLEENVEYARRLLRAGVPVELHVYPGGFHGFDIHPSARISQAARRDSVAALRRFLALP